MLRTSPRGAVATAALAAAALALAANAPAARADTTLAELERPTPVSAFGGRVVGSAFDFSVGRYRLMTRFGDVTEAVPIAPR